jgi:hypothetical protein
MLTSLLEQFSGSVRFHGMTRYANLSGDSPIGTFKAGDDFIDVRFDGWIYRYDYSRPGLVHVERMKQLAASGEGLATYISTQVRDRYASKRRA